MPCIENKCAIMNMYPNTDAGLACDCDCYLDEPKNSSIMKYWKRTKSKEMECYIEK